LTRASGLIRGSVRPSLADGNGGLSVEAISLSIGLAGLVVGLVALQPILQMYFGAARITFEPSKMPPSGAVALVIKLVNPAVECHFSKCSRETGFAQSNR
jgi:hypothetical protein